MSTQIHDSTYKFIIQKDLNPLSYLANAQYYGTSLYLGKKM